MTPLALILTLSGVLVIDGDTFHDGPGKYRLWGIDAPERGDPGAAQSKAALSDLVQDQPVACDVLDVDRYGRSVVRCLLPDGRDLACQLVASGHARDWPKYSDGYYAGCDE